MNIFHIHSREQVFNFNQIDEFLFAGSNQCCYKGLHELLVKEDVSIDVSLEEEEIDAPYGVSSYHWLPIIDHGIPTIEQIEMFIAIIEASVKMKKKVYVHCKNGHGRTGAMLISYYMKTRSMTFDDAFVFVLSRRPTVHLSDEQAAFLKNLK